MGNKTTNTLSGKFIFIDPGHGGTAETDTFRVGPTGEREEWINLRVALELSNILVSHGAKVLLSRTEDVAIALHDRAKMARKARADIFISIHHNATADSTVNFPVIYFYGNATENQASVKLGKLVIKRFLDEMYDRDTPASLVSDHVIFPNSGAAVLRSSYGIPGIIGEASYFTNPAEEQRLMQQDYNQSEARAYALAIEDFLAIPVLPILEKYSKGKIEPFTVFQEGERMSKTAKQWYVNYAEGIQLSQSTNPDSLAAAYELLTLSARSFPDSWVAGPAHQIRSIILEKQGDVTAFDMESRRVKEFYIDIR